MKAPVRAIIMARHYPGVVLGYTSPYPTVVMVITVSQMKFW
jgi:hypothetical protein